VFEPADQPNLLAARQLQAMSFAFHIVLVCFGVALPAITLVAEGLWLKTGDPVYRQLAKRWSRVMILLFAVGAVSGTILSFELGVLWPNFMATFGEVFGLAFALEGFAFFIEAIFLAVYVYGWERLSPRVHFLAGLPMVVTGIAGSFFVIAVNGFMNQPTGFELVDGQVVDPQPWEALFNGAVGHELVHMTLAGYMVAGFALAAVAAWGWMHGRRDRIQRAAFVIPFTIACAVAPVQALVGDWAARDVAAQQPVKLAAMEGLGPTTQGAPLTMGGWYDGEDVRFGVSIPDGLSLLAFHDPNATVSGLDSVPPEDRPPVNVVRFSFHAMVAIGTALIALAAIFFWVRFRRGRLPRSRWFWRAAVAAGPASVVALWAGWTTTEVGRQPWIVRDAMRTSEAVTAADAVPVAYVVLALVYLVLAIGAGLALRGLGGLPEPEPEPSRPGRPAESAT
jgi:cytochrome d ubiquinol oxidase subunit I